MRKYNISVGLNAHIRMTCQTPNYESRCPKDNAYNVWSKITKNFQRIENFQKYKFSLYNTIYYMTM